MDTSNYIKLHCFSHIQPLLTSKDVHVLRQARSRLFTTHLPTTRSDVGQTLVGDQPESGEGPALIVGSADQSIGQHRE